MSEPLTNYKSTPSPTTIVLDAHLIKTYRACEQKFKWFQEEHVIPKAMKAAPSFGIAMHDGLAGFRQAKKDGADYSTAYEKGAKDLLESYKKHMPLENQSEVKQDDARSARNALRLYTGFCEHFEPAGLEYLYVEVPFALFLDQVYIPLSDQKKDVIYTGIIDAVIKDHGVVRVNDIKSSGWTITDKSLNIYKMDQGLKGYVVATKQLLGLDTNYACVHALWVQGEPKDPKRAKPLDSYFHNKDLYWDDEQLEEWKLDTLRTAVKIETSKLTDEWQKDNGQNCGAFGGCDYLDLCSRTPSARQQLIDLDFAKGIWTPLESERMQKL